MIRVWPVEEELQTMSAVRQVRLLKLSHLVVDIIQIDAGCFLPPELVVDRRCDEDINEWKKNKETKDGLHVYAW
jgi:hypothetical protein